MYEARRKSMKAELTAIIEKAPESGHFVLKYPAPMAKAKQQKRPEKISARLSSWLFSTDVKICCAVYLKTQSKKRSVSDETERSRAATQNGRVLFET